MKTRAESRQAVAKVLRAFRRQAGKTAEEMARELGWLLRTYEAAEVGAISLSAGQQNDVRRVMKKAQDKAAIRDRLRVPGRRRLV